MTHNSGKSPFSNRCHQAGAMAVALLLATAIGCGGYVRPVGIPVSGTVTLDGKPVNAGTVVFKPRATKVGTSSVPGGTSAAATIRDGKFSLDEAEGPPAGTADIEVIVQRDLGFAIDDEAAFAKKGGSPLNGKVDFKDPKAKSVEIAAGGPALVIEMVTTAAPAATSNSGAEAP